MSKEDTEAPAALDAALEALRRLAKSAVYREDQTSHTYAKKLVATIEAALVRGAPSGSAPPKERWYITAEWVNDGNHRQLTLTANPFDENDEPVILIRGPSKGEK